MQRGREAARCPKCDSVAAALADAGLPPVTARYLGARFSAEQWETAEVVTAALREHFSGARFAEETTYGVLLVPDPGKLDTRRAMGPDVRRDQLGRPTPDVFDERLTPGTLGIGPGPGQDWTLVATVTDPTGSPSAATRRCLVVLRRHSLSKDATRER